MRGGAQVGRWLHNPCCRVLTALERGVELEVAHKWARWQHSPCPLGCPQRFKAGVDSEVAHKWAR